MLSIFFLKPGFFRLILAVMVVFYHLTKYVYLGGAAVYCFFILSGYWIVRMYNENYQSKKRATLKFYATRIIRIYPLYLLMTVLAMVMNFIFMEGYLDTIKAYSFFNWITIFGLLGYNTGPWVIPPAWSLDIEMQFYLIFPIIWFIVFKLKKTFLFLLISFLFWINFCFDIVDLGNGFKHTVIPFLFYFVIGGILHLKKNIFTKTHAIIGLFLFIGIVLIHYTIPILSMKVLEKSDPIYFEQINLLLPILLIPFISFNLKEKSNAKDRFYGNLSYVIYLFHWVLIIPYNYLAADLAFIQRMPYALIYIVLTILGSVYILKYIEQPTLDKLKSYIK